MTKTMGWCRLMILLGDAGTDDRVSSLLKPIDYFECREPSD